MDNLNVDNRSVDNQNGVTKKRGVVFATIALFVALSACGGGGGGGGGGPSINPQPAQPVPEFILPEPAPAAPDISANAEALNPIKANVAHHMGVTGSGMVIGFMEPIDHFHHEFEGRIHPDSQLAAYYDGPMPDEKFITDTLDKYPPLPCLLQAPVSIPCPGGILDPDTGENYRYFLRTSEGEIRQLPYIQPAVPRVDLSLHTTHGTQVASVAAAGDDEFIIGSFVNAPLLGVAYDAEILVYTPPLDALGMEIGAELDLTPFISYIEATPERADVYNISMGRDESYNFDDSDMVEERYGDLARALIADGHVFTVSAGNRQSRTSPGTRPAVPAVLPIFYPELRGKLLAVAAIDDNRNGIIARYSNRCGDLPPDWDTNRDGVHYCLAAPGDVWTAHSFVDAQNQVQRGYFGVRGTSYSSPIVAASFVLMKQHFRSQMTDKELVLRMLSTANRGPPYNDPAIYGAGVVDLEAALQPVGNMRVGTGAVLEGTAVEFAGTALRLPAAMGPLSFGDREVMAMDSLNAPFWHSLDELVSVSDGRRTLPVRRTALFGNPNERVMVFEDGSHLTLSLYGRDDHPFEGRSPGLLPDRGLGGSDALSGDKGHRMRFLLRHPVGKDGMEVMVAGGDVSSLPVGLPLPLDGAGGVDHPYLGLAGEGFSAGGSVEVGSGRLMVLGFASEGTLLSGVLPGSSGDADVYGSLVGYGFPLPAGSRAGLHGGAVVEEGRSLGLSSRGAFGSPGLSSTVFGGVSLEADLGSGWRFAGRAMGGVTRFSAPSHGLIEDWSAMVSSSFAMGVEGRGLLRAGDRLGFFVHQPLRVERGSASFVVPVGRTPEGGLLRERVEGVSVSPAGRELEFSGRYEVPVSEGVSLKLGAGVVREGGHSPARGVELYGLGDLSVRF